MIHLSHKTLLMIALVSLGSSAYGQGSGQMQHKLDAVKQELEYSNDPQTTTRSVCSILDLIHQILEILETPEDLIRSDDANNALDCNELSNINEVNDENQSVIAWLRTIYNEVRRDADCSCNFCEEDCGDDWKYEL